MVELSIRKYGHGSLQYVTQSIRNDHNFLMKIVNMHDDASSSSPQQNIDDMLYHIGEGLKHDCDFIMMVMMKCASPSLCAVADELLNDREVVLLAVKMNPDNIDWIDSEDLMKDPEILIAVASSAAARKAVAAATSAASAAIRHSTVVAGCHLSVTDGSRTGNPGD